jgi:hypothetical protein
LIFADFGSGSGIGLEILRVNFFLDKLRWNVVIAKKLINFAFPDGGGSLVK